MIFGLTGRMGGFHVVFTVPHTLNPVFMGNRKAMFAMLLEAAHYTLFKLGRAERYIGAAPGIISVLHTFSGQYLPARWGCACALSNL